MYKLVKTIPQVQEFVFTKQEVVCIIDNSAGKLVYYEGQYLSDLEIQKSNSNYLTYNECLYYCNYEGECFEIDLINKTKTKISNRHMALLCQNGKTALVEIKEPEKRYTELWDIETKETQCQIESILRLNYLSSKIYSINYGVEHILLCYDPHLCKQVWQFDVSEIGKWKNEDNDLNSGSVVNIIGEWQNLLLIHVSRYKIIALEKDTGTFVWAIDDFIGDMLPYFPNVDVSGLRAFVRWQLDESNNKLLMLGRYFVIEIELFSREIQVLRNYLQEQEEERWAFASGHLKDGGIFFTGNKGMGLRKESIGFFDLERKDVIWQFTLDNKTGRQFFIKAPQLHNGKLYVKDTGNTLYIFEKQQ